jgi:hypothetical protein
VSDKREGKAAAAPQVGFGCRKSKRANTIKAGRSAEAANGRFATLESRQWKRVSLQDYRAGSAWPLYELEATDLAGKIGGSFVSRITDSFPPLPRS